MSDNTQENLAMQEKLAHGFVGVNPLMFENSLRATHTRSDFRLRTTHADDQISSVRRAPKVRKVRRQEFWDVKKPARGGLILEGVKMNSQSENGGNTLNQRSAMVIAKLAVTQVCPTSSEGGRIPPRKPPILELIFPPSPDGRLDGNSFFAIPETEYARHLAGVLDQSLLRVEQMRRARIAQQSPRWHLARAAEHLRRAVRLVFGS